MAPGRCSSTKSTPGGAAGPAVGLGRVADEHRVTGIDPRPGKGQVQENALLDMFFHAAARFVAPEQALRDPSA